MPIIHIAAALILRTDGQALVVRKRGSRFFMQAGGKIEAGESAEAALRRELAEELRLSIPLGYARYLGRHAAIAANEPGHRVEAEVFHVPLTAEARLDIAAEIEEALWIDPDHFDPTRLAALSRDSILPLRHGL